MVVLTQLRFTYTLRYSGLCGQRKKAKVACIFFPKCYSKDTGRMNRIETCPPQDSNNSGFTFSAHITVLQSKITKKQSRDRELMSAGMGLCLPGCEYMQKFPHTSVCGNFLRGLRDIRKFFP